MTRLKPVVKNSVASTRMGVVSNPLLCFPWWPSEISPVCNIQATLSFDTFAEFIESGANSAFRRRRLCSRANSCRLHFGRQTTRRKRNR